MDDNHAPLAAGGTADDGLACLVLLLGFHQIPADPGQLKHALGKSEAASAANLVRLARRLGARARLARSTPLRLQDVPVPAIAIGRDGGFFIIGGVRDGEVLIQAASGPPQTVDLAALEDRWSGDLILVTTRAEAGATGKFDVTWFIPALVKYRGLLGEVLTRYGAFAGAVIHVSPDASVGQQGGVNFRSGRG